jgi:hypothetical protein
VIFFPCPSHNNYHRLRKLIIRELRAASLALSISKRINVPHWRNFIKKKDALGVAEDETEKMVRARRQNLGNYLAATVRTRKPDKSD